MILMKVGVIGCGAIAQRVYLPTYKTLGLDIIGVADIKQRRAKRCAQKFGAEKWLKNYSDLLKNDLDLVTICTPPSTHAKIAIDAAKCGSHVLVEKPMATTLHDCDQLIRTCQESNVKLCVMQNYRMFPCVQEAKRRIEEGRLGRIVSIHAVGRDFIPLGWSSGTWFYHEWGLLEDLGSHLIDIVNFLLDFPSLTNLDVIARDICPSMGCFNHIHTLILFQEVTSVDLDLSWVTGAFEITLKILGTAGTIDLDVRNNHLRETHGYSTPTQELRSSFRKLLKIGRAVLNGTYFVAPILNQQLIIRQFLESIMDRHPPPITGEEGRAVVAVMEAIKKKAQLKAHFGN